MTTINISHADHVHFDVDLEALQHIEQLLREIKVTETEALDLLGQINDATTQVSASLDDAAGDIQTLIDQVAALPNVPTSVGAALTTLKDTLSAQAARAAAIASAFPPAAPVAPDATPGATP